MTLPLNSRLSALYDTNGTQKDFSFGFRVFFDPDNGGYGLEVRRQTADGYEVIPKSDYLVLPVEDNSAGVVRFSVAPSAGQQIYIAGKTPTIQQLVLTNFGRYSAESIETQFDFITAIIQEWLSALGEETRQRISNDEISREYANEKFIEIQSWVYDQFPDYARSAFDEIFEGFYSQWVDALNELNKENLQAENVFDGDENQHEINKSTIRTVDSVVELAARKNPRDGELISVKSYAAGTGFGGGTYRFEQLSSKTPNGGAWISGIGGVWVLVSDLHFENFGVTDANEDQSDKIQSCIDFAQSQNIVSYGFQKSFKCRIDKTIVFRAIKPQSDWGMPDERTEISMRGSMFVSAVNNLTYIRILRDRVEFKDTLAVDGLGSTGQVGIALGYEKTDDPMDTSVRRSACFMVLNGYFPANIDIGIKSNIPRSVNGSAYGMYNHKIYNFDARHVNIGWYADKGFADDTVTNKLTRTRVFGFGHIDGSCSFYMLACESFKCYGYSGENLRRDDPRLPDGKAVAWYSPEKANPIDTYQNSYNHISGFIELAYREYVNYSPFFTWDVQQWFTELDWPASRVGQAELSLSKMGIGSNGNFYDNKSLTDFHFKNGGYRTAVVSISASSPANASLPAFYAGKDFYGSAQWIPCSNNFEDIGLLILTDVFNTEGHRKFINQYSNGSWHGWVDFEYSYGIGRHSNFISNASLNNFRFNDGGIRFAQVSITGDDPTSAASTPNGSYFYGAIQWIQVNEAEGKQIAWGTAPNTNSQRLYVGGSWSSWVAL